MKKSGYKKLLLRLLAYKPWIFIISLLCNILIFSHSSAEAYFVREILNTVEIGVVGGKSYLAEIKIFLIGILAVALIRIIAIRICAVMDNIQRFYYDNLLRNNIMKLIYKQDNIKNVAGKSEKVFEILDDDVPTCAFPAELLSEVIGYVVYSLIAIASLLIVNWRVTIYIFIPITIAIMIIKNASNKIKKNRKVNREIHDNVSQSISDIANLVQTIKLSHAHEGILKHYEKLNVKRLGIMLKETLFESSIQTIIGGTVHIGTAIMMFIVAKSMINGNFLIGDFSMFVWYLGTFASCVDRIMELVSETKQAEVSYDRITELVGEENKDMLTKDCNLKVFKESEKFEYECMERTPLKELNIKNLSYCHDDRSGIYDINLTLKPGEIIVIAGGVGSGKSTLINVLMGVVPKDLGEFFWNGIEIKDNKEFFIPPNVAYTSQIPRLFSDTIGENILLGKDVCNEEIKEALSCAVFDLDVTQMENGIDTQIGSGGSKLSGGQKQRLALARMFIHDAELYLMDDSSSAIDGETEAKFWKGLEEKIRVKKFGCIIASNKKQVLQRADKIIFLKNGHILDCGKVNELSERCDEFAKIYSCSNC